MDIICVTLNNKSNKIRDRAAGDEAHIVIKKKITNAIRCKKKKLSPSGQQSMGPHRVPSTG